MSEALPEVTAALSPNDLNEDLNLEALDPALLEDDLGEEDLGESPEEGAGLPLQGKRGMIGKAVAAAVQLWLRSKLQKHERLELSIQASNRQLLTGQIPQVDVVGEGLVYRGIHLRQIKIQGSQIKMNLGGVIRGQSFQLKQPIRVAANLELAQADLEASLDSPLLAKALKALIALLVKSTPSFAELITELLQGEATAVLDLKQIEIKDPKIRLGAERVSLGLPLVTSTGKILPLFLRFGLGLENPQRLKFYTVEWLTSLEANRGMAIPELDGLSADLGTDVALHSLDLQPDALRATGQFTVRP
jgi:hypothetical protein